MFCSRSFIVSGLKLKSLIHFELVFCVWCMIVVQFHSFACGYPVFPPPFVEETVLSPLSGLGTLVEDQMTRVHFWMLCCVALCVCLYAITTLFWLLQLCNKFWNLEVWDLQLCFSFERWFWPLGFVEIPYEF